jgi:hypothetical protein
MMRPLDQQTLVAGAMPISAAPTSPKARGESRPLVQPPVTRGVPFAVILHHPPFLSLQSITASLQRLDGLILTCGRTSFFCRGRLVRDRTSGKPKLTCRNWCVFPAHIFPPLLLLLFTWTAPFRIVTRNSLTHSILLALASSPCIFGV